jgi:putative membrane protein
MLSHFLTNDLFCSTGHLSAIAEAQAACERIKNTPLPLPYVVQLRQFMFLMAILSPIIFQTLFPKWGSVVASALFAFGLFGIECAGRIIEDPFGDDMADLNIESYVMGCEVVGAALMTIM